MTVFELNQLFHFPPCCGFELMMHNNCFLIINHESLSSLYPRIWCYLNSIVLKLEFWGCWRNCKSGRPFDMILWHMEVKLSNNSPRFEQIGGKREVCGSHNFFFSPPLIFYLCHFLLSLPLFLCTSLFFKTADLNVWKFPAKGWKLYHGMR